MVELKGSEKQVKWANDIRKMLEEIKTELNTFDVSKFEKDSIEEDWYVKAADGLDKYLNTDSAKELIDKFSKLKPYMIENLKKETSNYKKLGYISVLF